MRFELCEKYVVVITALTVIATLGMGCSLKTEKGCTRGAIQSCVCSGAVEGTQACNSDGKSWKTCECATTNVDAGNQGDAIDADVISEEDTIDGDVVSLDNADAENSKLNEETITIFPKREIDILFVVDNSDSMGDEQKNLRNNFPELIEALRSQDFGGGIPNVRIGVISTDLGAGNFDVPECAINGDNGKLQATPKGAGGCPAPKNNPWIDYSDGTVNVQSTLTTDPIELVKQSFACIANLGVGGCGFEHQLESARRALDPAMNINPGFLRDGKNGTPNALLAIVFITDEDDCSAQDTALFDENAIAQYGPFSSFRCFEFGIQCDINDRTIVGPRANCVPGGSMLFPVTTAQGTNSYESFFKSLKPAGSIVVTAIAGPAQPVSVGSLTSNGKSVPTLEPSCHSALGEADPAIRIKALTDSFGADGEFFSVCQAGFGPVMKALGKKLVEKSTEPCVTMPILNNEGKLACAKNTTLDAQGTKCPSNCLDSAECEVTATTSSNPQQQITLQKCPKPIFDAVDSFECGQTCPCWRLVPSATCEDLGSRYRFEILSSDDAASIESVKLACSSSVFSWGDANLNSHGICQ